MPPLVGAFSVVEDSRQADLRPGAVPGIDVGLAFDRRGDQGAARFGYQLGQRFEEHDGGVVAGADEGVFGFNGIGGDDLRGRRPVVDCAIRALVRGLPSFAALMKVLEKSGSQPSPGRARRSRRRQQPLVGPARFAGATQGQVGGQLRALPPGMPKVAVKGDAGAVGAALVRPIAPRRPRRPYRSGCLLIGAAVGQSSRGAASVKKRRSPLTFVPSAFSASSRKK